MYNTNINVQSMDSYHAGDIICQQDIGGSLIVLKTDEYIMCIEIDTWYMIAHEWLIVSQLELNAVLNNSRYPLLPNEVS